MSLDPGSVRGRSKNKPKKASDLLKQLRDDTRSLNSAVSVLTQKIKFLVRNEKILGQNLVVLNKKISRLQQQSEQNQGIPSDLMDRLAEIEKKLELQEARIEQLNELVNRLSTSNLSETELKELQHLVKSINPLEFVTLEQLKDYVDSRLSRKNF